jgi:formylmethanofuran dehydrogenase subunit C
MKIDSNIAKVGIKRSDDGSSIDQLFGYDASDVENTSTIEVTSGVAELIEDYKVYSYLSEQDKNKYPIKTVLSPGEINRFLQATRPYKEIRSSTLRTGSYINALIENSYNEGYNDFYLNLVDLPFVTSILKNISADEKNPIKIKIDGGSGHAFCNNAKNINAIINGNIYANSCLEAKNLNLLINGTIYNGFGEKSENMSLCVKGDIYSTFCLASKNLLAIIDGNVGSQFCGESKNAIVSIKGDVEEYFGRNSTNMASSIIGNVSNYFGVKSSSLKTLIGGNVGGHFGYDSRNLSAIVNKDVGANFGHLSLSMMAFIFGNEEQNFLQYARGEKIFRNMGDTNQDLFQKIKSDCYPAHMGELCTRSRKNFENQFNEVFF